MIFLPPSERNFVLPALIDLGHALARFQPKIRPYTAVFKFQVGILFAPYDKPRKSLAPGMLTDRIVAQVEAPTNPIADVGQRSVNRVRV